LEDRHVSSRYAHTNFTRNVCIHSFCTPTFEWGFQICRSIAFYFIFKFDWLLHDWKSWRRMRFQPWWSISGWVEMILVVCLAFSVHIRLVLHDSFYDSRSSCRCYDLPLDDSNSMVWHEAEIRCWISHERIGVSLIIIVSCPPLTDCSVFVSQKMIQLSLCIIDVLACFPRKDHSFYLFSA